MYPHSCRQRSRTKGAAVTFDFGRQGEPEYDTDTDAPVVTKPRVYRCADRMCGADDCATCQGLAAAMRFVETLNKENYEN
jgi:hypothetical protein